MERERLERLIVVLEEVAAAKLPFDLGNWAEVVNEDGHMANSTQEACGTAACACGYAALDPVLKRQGLRLGYSAYTEENIASGEVKDVAHFNNLLNKAKKEDWNDLHFGLRLQGETDMQTGYDGWGPVTSFFNLTEREALYLFMEDNYAKNQAGPLDVARRIRQVLDQGFPNPIPRVRNEDDYYEDSDDEDSDEDSDADF